MLLMFTFSLLSSLNAGFPVLTKIKIAWRGNAILCQGKLHVVLCVG